MYSLGVIFFYLLELLVIRYFSDLLQGVPII
jgi:hypothetical protein